MPARKIQSAALPGKVSARYVWLCCGIPFGIRRMFVWLIPRGFDLSGTVGVVALNFIVGGLIGGVILIWRLAVEHCFCGFRYKSPVMLKSRLKSGMA